MGTDIDGYMEVKKEGDWEFEDDIPDDQSYDTFAVIGNVRNYINADPLTHCRGIPEDTSDQTIDPMYNCDDYAHSWFDYTDVENYNWDNETQDTRDPKRKYNKAKDYLTEKWKKFVFEKMKGLSEKYGKTSVRIVFWFRN